MTEALSVTGNDRIVPGGNMSPFDKVSLDIETLYEEAKNWADGEPIANQEQHDAVQAVYRGLQDLGNKAEALRVAEVAPLDEEKAKIQKRFHPLIGDTKTAGKGKVVLGKAALNDMLTAWRVAEAAKKAAAAKKAREEADAIAAAAQEAIRASSGNLEAREEAEKDLTFAKEVDGFANRREREATSGLGLRTSYRPELTDLNAAIKHYWATRRVEFEQLVTELAKNDVRAGKRTIPGFIIHEDKKAL